MKNRKPDDNYNHSKSPLSEFIRNIPFTVRVLILTILVGLSLVSYNIGKAVTDARNNGEVNFSQSSKRKQKTNLDDLKIRRTNGNWEFSSDGGITWSRTAPEGIYEDEDGRLRYNNSASNNGNNSSDEETFKFPISDKNGKSTIMKRKDNKWKFSSDGGKTWSEEAPEGFSDKVKSVITKQSEDGKTLYSTDGGKTWSEQKPEGYEIPSVDDILDSIPDGILPKNNENDEEMNEGQATAI